MTNSFWIWRLGEKELGYSSASVYKTIDYFKNLDLERYKDFTIGVPRIGLGTGGLSFLDHYYVHGSFDLQPSEDIIKNIDKYNRNKTIVLGLDQWYESYNAKTLKVVDKSVKVYEFEEKYGVIPEDEIFYLLYSGRNYVPPIIQ